MIMIMIDQPDVLYGRKCTCTADPRGKDRSTEASTYKCHFTIYARIRRNHCVPFLFPLCVLCSCAGAVFFDDFQFWWLRNEPLSYVTETSLCDGIANPLLACPRLCPASSAASAFALVPPYLLPHLLSNQPPQLVLNFQGCRICCQIYQSFQALELAPESFRRI